MGLERRQQIRASRLLSRMLRHEPERFDVELDLEGFAEIKTVLAAVRRRFPEATREDILQIVAEDTDKQRFTIDQDSIRANYGHSIAARILNLAAEPPAQLLHGTHTKAVTMILKAGLSPMKRQYVHLTPNAELAARVGARHGTQCLIVVDAARAHAEGVHFYRANETFWLADRVPAQYLQPRFSCAP